MDILDITTASEEVTISRKKLYCFARMYQALETTGSPFSGCAYCKVHCNDGDSYRKIKDYFRRLTGVNLSIILPQEVNLDTEQDILI
jgi:hypothetical protein